MNAPEGSDDGDRQMVKILAAVLSDGLAAVEAACSDAPVASIRPMSSSTSWPTSPSRPASRRACPAYRVARC
jgi:hypothetical protein